jgi:hypothetical protein
MTQMIFEAVKKTGQRALVSKGWGGLGGSELDIPEGVFMLGNCPHDCESFPGITGKVRIHNNCKTGLFQHVSAVVHHGGAGTMSAGISLGRPTVIVPFFGDQPFWGAMVARAGAGPTPVPFKQLTAEKLAASILEALKPETLERAKELGELIREERGCAVGAESFHANMNMNRMRCMMVPSKVAVWRIKTNGKTEDVRLSAFAANILGAEGIIDVNQLKLYRPCEYAVQESVAVSNATGANPILGTVGSFASGLLHIPINVGKAWAGVVYEPYKGAKADSWRGFGKGLGKGFGGLIFHKRGLVLNGREYGTRALYREIRKKMGSGTLSFILAAHFAQGFQEASTATEVERLDVLARWNELSPDLKREQSSSSRSSSMGLSRLMSSSSSVKSVSTTKSDVKTTAAEKR